MVPAVRWSHSGTSDLKDFVAHLRPTDASRPGQRMVQVTGALVNRRRRCGCTSPTSTLTSSDVGIAQSRDVSRVDLSLGPWIHHCRGPGEAGILARVGRLPLGPNAIDLGVVHP